VSPEPVEKELPPDALAALGTHANELLDVTTKAMQSKESVTSAYSSVFASAMDDSKAAIEAGQARHADSPYNAAAEAAPSALILSVLAPKPVDGTRSIRFGRFCRQTATRDRD
jgi:hypothetical protein